MARGTKMRKWAVHWHTIVCAALCAVKTGTAMHLILAVILGGAPGAEGVRHYATEGFSDMLAHLMLGGDCRPEAVSSRLNGREIRHGRESDSIYGFGGNCCRVYGLHG
jgi:hypothetical protein